MAAGTKHYSAELTRDAVAELVGQGSTECAAMKKTTDLNDARTRIVKAAAEFAAECRREQSNSQKDAV